MVTTLRRCWKSTVEIAEGTKNICHQYGSCHYRWGYSAKLRPHSASATSGDHMLLTVLQMAGIYAAVQYYQDRYAWCSRCRRWVPAADRLSQLPCLLLSAGRHSTVHHSILPQFHHLQRLHRISIRNFTFLLFSADGHNLVLFTLLWICLRKMHFKN